MVDAQRRRRRNELAEAGVVIAVSMSEPKKLEQALRKGLPDIELPARQRVKNPEPWWARADSSKPL